MKKNANILLLLLLLVGCRLGGDDVGEETAVPLESLTIDEDTGLPINPPDMIDGEFILEGEVIAVNLVPQDKPLFKLRMPDGNTFQISAQPVSDIKMVDGSELTSLELRNGIFVRATVVLGDDVGLGGEPVLTSKDLTVMTLVE